MNKLTAICVSSIVTAFVCTGAVIGISHLAFGAYEHGYTGLAKGKPHYLLETRDFSSAGSAYYSPFFRHGLPKTSSQKS